MLATRKCNLYKQQFFLIRQGSQETFSDLYQEVCCMYDLCKFEKEGRCIVHKDCSACRKSARDIRINDILTIAVRDNDVRTEFMKLIGKDITETRFYQEGTNWDMDNAIKIGIMPLKQ